MAATIVRPPSVSRRAAAGVTVAAVLALVALPSGQAGRGPAKVVVQQVGGRFQLLVDGRPFRIDGAGFEARRLDSLDIFRGNSIRTWRPDNGPITGEALLDAAHARGVRVAMGLPVGARRTGDDAADARALAEQRARVRTDVLRFKDHPALLMWLIGNELNLGNDDPRTWDVVNDLSRLIHELDPNHPTLTPLAGFNRELAGHLRVRAPDLDAVGIQLYGDVVSLPRYLREARWTGPYVVTEWGTTGHWEVFHTPWGAPIEYDSTAKADAVRQRYETVIAADTTQSLGSFVFLWGQKQERTPTWYGMLLATGEKTPVVDVMHRVWTGSWPDNRCPTIEPPRLDGRLARDGVRLTPGASYAAEIAATDPDGDALRVEWVVMEESRATSVGGAREDIPAIVDGSVVSQGAMRTSVVAPAMPGAYRLFVYVRDGRGAAAHANIPFLVEPAGRVTP